MEKGVAQFARKQNFIVKTLQIFMLSKKQSDTQLSFYSTFEEQLSHRHALYILANKIDWNIFEETFAKLYSEEGRPAKPIRLMVSLALKFTVYMSRTPSA